MYIRLKSICYRWSFGVPILFYTCFCGLIWTLTVPLKSEMQINNIEKTLKEEFDKSLRELPNVYNENTYNLRSRNDDNNNINSNNNKVSQTKNEYLININDNEYENKDPKEVLEEVFNK